MSTRILAGVCIGIAISLAAACTAIETVEENPPPLPSTATATVSPSPTLTPESTPTPIPEPTATSVVPTTQPPTPTVTSTPSSTPLPVPTLAPTPTTTLSPTPTSTAAPTPVPTAQPTPMPAAVQGFGEGTWVVGDDIQPGTYAAGPGLDFCSWERLSGFSGEFEDIIAIDVGDPRPIVTIFPTDAGFTSASCGEWLPIADAVTTPSGDGTWVVGSELASGTYAAGPGLEFCSWERLSGFSGEFEDIIAIDVGDPRPIVTIFPTDAGFTSTNCGEWVPIADAVTTPSGDGTWVVGSELASGTYTAPGGDFCSWSRLSGFSGEFDDIVAIEVGNGRQVVTIEETDAGFTSQGCGAWVPLNVDALAMYDDNGNGRISCAEARNHGIAPVRRDQPAYPYMDDRDGDGIVCE